MSDSPSLLTVPNEIAAAAWIDDAKYKEMYAQSIADPEAFWADQGTRVSWIKPFTKVKDVNYGPGDVHIRWFEDGTLNVSANCIDRHLATKGDDIAIIWEGDDPNDQKHITYAHLHDEVCRMANVLKARGIKKGDVVTIYMPMIPEAAYAMLACTRIGAIHSVVFGGFSPEALKDRILDGGSTCVISADEGVRGGRTIPLKANTDKALALTPDVHTCLVVRRTGGDIDWVQDRDVWWHEAASGVDSSCAPEEMGAEDPLFILYTSGSTGK
ncbi:MAG: AMP-binding protein, partial [Pseudomonadota bacterium]